MQYPFYNEHKHRLHVQYKDMDRFMKKKFLKENNTFKQHTPEMKKSYTNLNQIFKIVCYRKAVLTFSTTLTDMDTA